MPLADLINPRDLDFQLYAMNDALGLTARTRYAEHGRETFQAALDTAAALALERFMPHNRRADEAEPRFVDGRVAMLDEVRDAVRACCEAGFLSATAPFEQGGMQLPVLVAQACWSLFRSANVATTSYVGLTAANANVIERFGTPAQRQRYLPGLRSGRFFGTMALTEPQAGSSLSDLTTRATPGADGLWRLRGQKIFISGGDHELAENIVHLVLGRLPDAPAGVKGLSLFIVPKFHVHDDGSLGARNDVALAGLIHKCGWRGTTSTLLSFGEGGDCTAELIGEPHAGLACMFHMMNEARIGVGMGAVMLGYRGYLAALAYARERRQGRRPGSKDPLAPPRPLIEHADVRRMLLAQKAYVEGGFALSMYAARLVDEQRSAPEPAARAEAGQLLDLLTPVVKSWPSQWCLEANSLAIQVLGGYGYTREYPVEQYWRDNRLNMIHEGTHGIQALDLLGRKVMQGGGAALALFLQRVGETVAAARGLAAPAAAAAAAARHDRGERPGHAPSQAPCPDQTVAAAGTGEPDLADLPALATALSTAWSALSAAVQMTRTALHDDAEAALANATPFLDAFGHGVMAWIWLRQAVVAARALQDGEGARDDEARSFHRGKLQACRWFFAWELPRVAALLQGFCARDPSALAMQDDWF
jgi:butyryl-CoA dehydrogenase